MAKQYKAFYDRQPNTIHGWFTILEYDSEGSEPQKIINRIPAVSGQKGYENSSWATAKSPIPYNVEVKGGKLWLWLSPVAGEISNSPLAPTKGIGEFWPISSSETNRSLIVGLKNQQRAHIGGHDDNSLLGTAGCIGYTKDKDTLRVSAVLHSLKEKGIQKIPLEVL